MAEHLAEPPPVLVAALAVPAVKEALIRRLLEKGLATTAADAQAMPPLVRTAPVRSVRDARNDGPASCDSRRG